MKKLFLFLVLSTIIYALPQDISYRIGKSKILKKDVAIYIKEVGTNGKVLASLNSDKAFSPASVLKVLSTYTSLARLGFNYRFKTKFYITGYIKNGVLNGDFIIKASGDPTFNQGNLKEIVNKIKAKGIREIRGNIIIDRSYFKVSSKDNSGFDNNTYSAYNAMPDAMMFNQRISTIAISPRSNKVVKKNGDNSYIVINNLKPISKPCRGKYAWPYIKIDKSSTTPMVLLKGKISNRCRTRNICKVITKPYKSIYYAIKYRLKQNGINLNGKLKLQRVPQSAKLLFTHYSKTLEKIVSITAKKSNNLFARHLMLNLGASIYGSPATLSKGRSAIKYMLQRDGIRLNSDLLIDNGCGLSRKSRVSAELFAKVFDVAYRRYGQRWLNTLSIAGVDGTIRRRFAGSVVRKRAFMKTGTLKYVKNIGGYVKAKNGKTYIVVILVNSKKAKYRGALLQNWIITDLVNGSIVEKKEIQEIKEIEISPKIVNGGYYIEVASFNSMPPNEFMSKILNLGLPYKIGNVDNRYKVLIGGYNTIDLASKDLANVREHINRGSFITKIE